MDDAANFPFLAQETEQSKNSLSQASTPGIARDNIESKVYVWGLNDKDQLGGLKGSKIKEPKFSEAISSLKPMDIAGGSKSLFVGE